MRNGVSMLSGHVKRSSPFCTKIAVYFHSIFPIEKRTFLCYSIDNQRAIAQRLQINESRTRGLLSGSFRESKKVRLNDVRYQEFSEMTLDDVVARYIVKGHFILVIASFLHRKVLFLFISAFPHFIE